MAGFLIGGVGETRQRLFNKYMLRVTGPKATNECQYGKICDGLKEAIDRSILGVQAICDNTLSIEDWVFLLVDSKNLFNGINRTVILWTVCQLCPSKARFLKLLLSLVIARREGVTQGEPLAMVAYEIGVLPLIKRLKSAYPGVIQPWYADDVGARLYFISLK